MRTIGREEQRRDAEPAGPAAKGTGAAGTGAAETGAAETGAAGIRGVPQPASHPRPLADRSVAALQGELRRAFADGDVEAGLDLALARIGAHFEGVYVTFQADVDGVHFVADWTWEGFASIAGLRESLGSSIADVMTAGAARLVPLGGPAAPALLAVPVLDTARRPVGVACAVVGGCGAHDATGLLAVFEGTVGYLMLLVAQAARATGRSPGRFAVAEAAAATGSDPLLLAYALVADLRNRHDLDQVLLGFVRGRRVRVAAVCGLDEVRSANPGAKIVAAAMEECLDRGAPVVYPAAGAETGHLHARWSRATGHDPVASIPLTCGGETVAIASVTAGPARRLDGDDIARLQQELQSFAWLLPLSRAASRGLPAHAAQSLAGGLRRVLGAGWRARATALLAFAFGLWVAFGSLPYSFTVRCGVIAAEPRAISSPREGILREIFVRPGDPVREGQLLAQLDTGDERLEAAALRADLRRIDARVDQARAEGNPGDVKVHAAQRDAVAARLELVQLRIVQSHIRAPRPGRILEGDLERSLGARLALGDPLFLLAHQDRVQIEVRIPESQVWQARECRTATFAPAAHPADRVVLDGLHIQPAAVTGDGANVFLGRSEPFVAPRHLTPGMEGAVYLEVGDRSVWWVLTHHITDWLRLRFLF